MKGICPKPLELTTEEVEEAMTRKLSETKSRFRCGHEPDNIALPVEKIPEGDEQRERKLKWIRNIYNSCPPFTGLHTISHQNHGLESV